MRHSVIGIILIFSNLIFFLTVEVLEALYFESCPIIFSVSKTLILLSLDIIIVFSIKNQNTDCLFLGVVIYLIYSCILFFFHLLFEINQYEQADDILYNLLVVFNIFSAFVALFGSISLFLLRSEIKETIKSITLLI
jgi:hypothetical protein